MTTIRAARLTFPRANGLVEAATRRYVAQAASSSPALLLSSRPRRAPSSPATTALTPSRPFRTSPSLQKKLKAKKMAEQEAHNPNSVTHHDDPAEDAKHPKPNPADLLDLTDLTTRWSALDAHYRDALKKLSTGGRFNPDVIGALPVTPDPKHDPGQRYPLRELAQVVPRQGRIVSLLVHDKAHVRPIVDAVQASPDFNQQPQRSPDNDLELTLTVEPERREDLAARAHALTHIWRDRVRQATEKRRKVHAKWLVQKEVVPDLKRRADAEVLKVQTKVLGGIDTLEKETLARLK
ncbi:ribosome recycling factor [Sodiomyces alkalinus F11]|uniref:Ribosome recycling factor n=1 Tax=Sodiomyces alkalinus (strain CBS 110278 / VKM F-3762 / F11) TaxID=1314773 RepID=A0A3N2PYH5_SODAK|nr:ribosome recycling factor [Sodiomyces alkalinus F11]ROT39532.1 ribosome recycling factor [Sodiomyces alkalinus F11]